MENMGELEKNLINELEHGRELARRLQMCLHEPSASQETRELLIRGIISAFEKALALAKWKVGSSVTVGEPSSQPTPLAIRMSESPPLSGTASPRSEDSDRDNQDQNASGNRKSLPRWTRQIKVSPGVGVEGPLDDGYSWRKYGQKDILGAKHPRGYYRCTHRNVQGCLATKQVQRSDEDPTIFEITYRGKHTCTLASSGVPPPGTQESQELTNPNSTELQQPSQEDLLYNLRAGLRVQTQNLDVPGPEQSFASWLFASTSSNMNHENPVFTSSMMEMEQSFAENFSSDPSYMSPATSGVSYFSVSSSGVNHNSLCGQLDFASSGSEMNGMISAVTSAANSPTIALDIPIDQYGFDGHNFTFDNPRFF